MIYIRKRKTPLLIRTAADNIKKILCCDASRGEDDLTINPWDLRQMEAIHAMFIVLPLCYSCIVLLYLLLYQESLRKYTKTFLF